MATINNNLPEIILAAATSTLGIFALMIIVLGVLSVILFENAPNHIKVSIYVMLFGGVLLFGFTIKNEVVPTPVSSSPPEFSERVLKIMYQIRMSDEKKATGIDLVTSVRLGSTWTSPVGFEGRQAKVVVDEKGYYEAFTKSIHTKNKWEPGGRLQLDVVEAISSWCHIRVQATNGDALFGHKNPQ